MISLTTLPRLDPRAASRYYLTGETFDAATAARIGLVTEAVDDIDAGTLAVLDALRARLAAGPARNQAAADARRTGRL